MSITPYDRQALAEEMRDAPISNRRLYECDTMISMIDALRVWHKFGKETTFLAAADEPGFTWVSTVPWIR
jgi:hypothetical protein